MNCILYQKTPPHTNSRFPHKEPIVSALYVWAGLCSVWCYVSKTRLIYVSPWSWAVCFSSTTTHRVSLDGSFTRVVGILQGVQISK